MIADTSAWVELFRATGSAAHLRLRRALVQGEPLRMLDAIYQELLQGARTAQHFVHLQAQLDMVASWLPDDGRETARQAALLHARCRWQGVTIRSPNDCLIAACAIEAGEPLLHADRDFERIASIEPKLHFV
jgi:predicted nucleic acid-binding protein